MPVRRPIVIFLILACLCACSKEQPPPKAVPTGTPTHRSKAITPGPGCKLPRNKPIPSWVPRSLPLPQGTYFYRTVEAKPGFRSGRFVLRIEAAAFGRFARSHWPPAGFALSRPDSEPGEVESLFTGRAGVGLFKANDVLCQPRYTRLILVFEQ